MSMWIICEGTRWESPFALCDTTIRDILLLSQPKYRNIMHCCQWSPWLSAVTLYGKASTTCSDHSCDVNPKTSLWCWTISIQMCVNIQTDALTLLPRHGLLYNTWFGYLPSVEEASKPWPPPLELQNIQAKRKIRTSKKHFWDSKGKTKSSQQGCDTLHIIYCI